MMYAQYSTLNAQYSTPDPESSTLNLLIQGRVWSREWPWATRSGKKRQSRTSKTPGRGRETQRLPSTPSQRSGGVPNFRQISLGVPIWLFGAPREGFLRSLFRLHSPQLAIRALHILCTSRVDAWAYRDEKKSRMTTMNISALFKGVASLRAHLDGTE
jgi:hypothetical protein